MSKIGPEKVIYTSSQKKNMVNCQFFFFFSFCDIVNLNDAMEIVELSSLFKVMVIDESGIDM